MKNDIHLDLDREKRIGQPEIIYGESKSIEQLLEIARQLEAAQCNALVTRLDKVKADALLEGWPKASYSIDGRCLTHLFHDVTPRPAKLAIVCGGTSDVPVLREAEATATFLGFDTLSYADIGVAGLHRFLDKLDDIRSADAVIVIAGFEGALASVVAGQVATPIIGVPTSVGYGVAQGGETALHAMLSSCANGLLVTNIDNGCGAVMAAARMFPVTN